MKNYAVRGFLKTAQNGANTSSTRHSSELGIVRKRVRMNTFLDASLLGGLLARMPNGFRIDRVIGAMVVVARKEPDSWFSA